MLPNTGTPEMYLPVLNTFLPQLKQESVHLVHFWNRMKSPIAILEIFLTGSMIWKKFRDKINTGLATLLVTQKSMMNYLCLRWCLSPW
jgi:hypothetical protein